MRFKICCQVKLINNISCASVKVKTKQPLTTSLGFFLFSLVWSSNGIPSLPFDPSFDPLLLICTLHHMWAEILHNQNPLQQRYPSLWQKYNYIWKYLPFIQNTFFGSITSGLIHLNHCRGSLWSSYLKLLTFLDTYLWIQYPSLWSVCHFLSYSWPLWQAVHHHAWCVSLTVVCNERGWKNLDCVITKYEPQKLINILRNQKF